MAEKKLKVLEEAKEIATQPKQDEAERLIALAIEKKVPVESLERLLTMRRELKAEKSKESFDRAMADFQAECPIIEKSDSAGSGSYNYKYATLDRIVRQVKELLAINGFSYTFDTKKTDRSLITYCKVKHKEGHMEVSEFEINIDTGSRMNISQKDGAANSYGKRYAFTNAFGILTSDEDTDTATNSSPKPLKAPEMAEKIENSETYSFDNTTSPRPIVAAQDTTNSGRLLTEKQKATIFSVLSDKRLTIPYLHDKLDKRFQKQHVSDLTIDEASKTIHWLLSVAKAPAINKPQDAPTDEIPFPDDTETDELINAADAAITAKEQKT